MNIPSTVLTVEQQKTAEEFQRLMLHVRVFHGGPGGIHMARAMRWANAAVRSEPFPHFIMHGDFPNLWVAPGWVCRKLHRMGYEYAD